MTQPTVATTPAPAEKSSLWEDFIDILFSPVSVFRRRERDSWVKPMLIVVIAIIVVSFASKGLLRPVFDAEIEKGMEKLRENPQVTEEMIERGRGMAEVFANVAIVVVPPITIFILGFMTWLVGKLVDARQELHAAMVVASYATVPRLVQAIANAVQGLVMKPEQLTGITALSFSPARFVDPASTSPVVVQLLNRFDLFTIWVTVLLAIGLYVTGRVSKQRATIAGVLFWVVGSLWPVLSALRQAK
jgi:hypothetical protein